MSKSRYPKYGSGNPSRVSRPGGRSSGASVSSMRTGLYKTAKILGDVSAVQSGNIGPRLVRRIAGKGASRGITGISKFF
jgi:hypothetical protein